MTVVPTGVRRASRVLVVARATQLHANAGGMEASADALIAALHRLGIATALITTAVDRNGPVPNDYAGHDHVWSVPTRKPGRYSRAWWRETRRDGPWNAWQPGLVLGIGDAAGSFTRTSRINKVPVVVHAHGTTWMEALSAFRAGGAKGYLRAALNLARTPSRRRHLRRAVKVLAAGPELVNELTGAPYRLSADRVGVVANSVDGSLFEFNPDRRTELRTSLGIPNEARVLLSAGRLAGDKGVDLAIDAVDRMPTSHLIVVGTGPAESALTARAARVVPTGRIHFVGNVSREHIAKFMSASDVLAFATRREEGLPMILLEAAANGLPMIATRRARIPSDFDRRRYALVAPEADALASAAASIDAERRPYLPAAFDLTTLAERLDAELPGTW